MGRLSGLKEGEAITADVNEERAEVGVLLLLVVMLLLLADEVLAEWGTDDGIGAPTTGPPGARMLKLGKVIPDDEEEGTTAEGMNGDGPTPRVAVKSSGEAGGWLAGAALLRATGSDVDNVIPTDGIV